MNNVLFTCVFAIALVTGVASAEPPKQQADTVKIPLDRIWAFEMPGTRAMSILMKGDPLAYESPEGPLVQEITKSLNYLAPGKGKNAAPGFAVVGTGIESLQEARDVLADKQDARRTFPTDSIISVVFFSNNASRYVFITNAERHNNSIDIRYRLVPHMTANTSVHLALIPLGQLPAGKYSVNMIRSPLEHKFVQEGVQDVTPDWVRRVVCDSFSFVVAD